MYRLAAALFAVAGDAIAHPGHGAPILHLHASDYAVLSLLLAVAAVGVTAALRARRQRTRKDQ